MILNILVGLILRKFPAMKGDFASRTYTYSLVGIGRPVLFRLVDIKNFVIYLSHMIEEGH